MSVLSYRPESLGVEFWRFLPADGVQGNPVPHSHSLLLVFCSLCIAVLAASILIPVIQRSTRSESKTFRRGWHLAGAIGIGIGVWGMHFTAMLALNLPITVAYDPVITAFSVVPAVVGSWLTILIMGVPNPSWKRMTTAALAMAVGIGAMHYTGMEAIITAAVMSYDIVLFVTSILIAFLLALAGLYSQQRILRSKSQRFSALAGSLALGTAVTAIHHAAMAATRFHLIAGNTADFAAGSKTLLAVEIVVVVSVIIGVILIGSIFDERQQNMHSMLRGSQAKFIAVIDSMPDAAIVVSLDGRIASMNKAVSKMFGCRRKDVAGLPVSNLLGADAMSVVDTAIARARQETDSSVHECDEGGLRRNGSYFPVEIIVTPFEMGPEQYLCLLIRNIQVRRAEEQQLRRAQKLESIGHLAAGIAHEINTPTQYVADNLTFISDAWQELNEIVAQVSLIVANEPGKRSSDTWLKLREAAEHADIAYLQNEMPTALSECISGVSKIRDIVAAMVAITGPTGEIAEKTNINKEIQNVVALTRREWMEVAEFDLQLDDTVDLVMLTPGRFAQAIIHLISNAAHAIEDANDARKGIIGFTTTQADGNVTLTIKDNGCGIDANALSQVFDYFYTTKEPGRGSGQGLSVVHGTICDVHGGEIDIASEVGVGTAVTISLSAVEQVQSGRLNQATAAAG